MSGQGNFEKQANQYRSEQAEKPTSTEAPKTSGTQHHLAEVNNMSGWATILARLATILAPWAPDWLPIRWIGNRLGRLANEAPIDNRGTQNIQGDYGNQANNSGIQHQPEIAFSQTTPAPATAQMPTTAPAPAPAPAPTSGTQNIQGKYGQQANNSGTQVNPKINFSQGTRTPANNSGT